jgi:hypothetical protein
MVFHKFKTVALSTTPERTRKVQVYGFIDWSGCTWLARDEQEGTPSFKDRPSGKGIMFISAKYIICIQSLFQ